MCMELPPIVGSPTGCRTLECLEIFFARELGCSPALLSQPGVHVLGSPNREDLSWCDFRLPFLLLSRRGSTVVSVARDLLDPIRAILTAGHHGLDPRSLRAVQTLVASAYPGGKSLWGHALYCEADGFRPSWSRPTEKLLPDDPKWEDFQDHFDGPVFVTRTLAGDVAAWSAIKLKSDDVWEIAVTTEERYRGRGLAKVVVSAATQHIIECGRVPLYVHDESNIPSGRVARSLGYLEFGVEAFCSLSDPYHPTSMW